MEEKRDEGDVRHESLTDQSIWSLGCLGSISKRAEARACEGVGAGRGARSEHQPDRLEGPHRIHERRGAVHDARDVRRRLLQHGRRRKRVGLRLESRGSSVRLCESLIRRLGIVC